MHWQVLLESYDIIFQRNNRKNHNLLFHEASPKLKNKCGNTKI